jgi:hypothetical protein
VGKDEGIGDFSALGGELMICSSPFSSKGDSGFEGKQKRRFGNEGDMITDPKPARRQSVILLFILFGLDSCHKQSQTNNSGQEALLNFNLSAIAGA